MTFSQKHRRRPDTGPGRGLLVITLAALLTAAAMTALPAAANSVAADAGRVAVLAAPTFGSAADAYVSQSSPNTNYGTSTTLEVSGKAGSAKNAYIRFSVTGVSGTVQNATLRVYATTRTSNGPAVYLAGNTWTESGSGGVTWNTKPGLLSSAVANKGAIAKSTWAEYNVTSLVTGNATYTFALVGDSSQSVAFSSREGTHPPQLVLTLAATPSPTPTHTPANTPTFTPTTAATSTPTSTGAPAATNTPTPAATSTSTPVATSTPTSTPAPLGSIQHVFIIVMENHGYSSVWNTSSSPYITSLGNTYARATNYYAITHPSLPNYLDMYGGSNYGITTDCLPSSTCHSTAQNLADNLDAKGLTWKGYMESMPAPCTLVNSGNYATKHDPFVYFDDIRLNSARCASHVVPFTALNVDLALAATTPNYAFITPDLCDDMHDCSVSTGDTWLSNHVPSILNSPACTQDTCLLVLTWDEDGNNEANHVLTIFAGSAAKTGGVTSSAAYNHFSLLRTVENIFGLPTQTGNDAGASPMNDLLR